MPILNKGHSRLFQKYISQWMTKFRLGEWDVTYLFRDDNFERLAECAPEPDVKQALIILFDHWQIEPSEEALEQTACHEVIHVLLSPLMRLAAERYTTEKQLADAEHDVIRALERVLF